MDRKKLLSGILVIALVVAAVVCLAPWPARIDLTLDAVKLDPEGNQIGSAEIRIEGYKLDYLFRLDRLDVTIEPFDNFKYFKLGTYTDGKTQVVGAVQSYSFADYFCTEIYGWDTQANDMFTGQLGFSGDFDRWILLNRFDDSGAYYVASVSDDDTVETLVEYFTYMIP